jgi:hypothetical protein
MGVLGIIVGDILDPFRSPLPPTLTTISYITLGAIGDLMVAVDVGMDVLPHAT